MSSDKPSSSSVGKSQIVHIVVEVILLIALVMYFSTQNKKLKNDINSLKATIQKHDQALKILFANTDIKKGLPASSFDNKQNQPNKPPQQSQQSEAYQEQRENDGKLETIDEDEGEEYENEEDEEFKKQVEKEVESITKKEEMKSILSEPDEDFDISGSNRNGSNSVAFQGGSGHMGIDTVLIIGKPEEDVDIHEETEDDSKLSIQERKSSQGQSDANVEFLPTKRKRVVKRSSSKTK